MDKRRYEFKEGTLRPLTFNDACENSKYGHIILDQSVVSGPWKFFLVPMTFCSMMCSKAFQKYAKLISHEY